MASVRGSHLARMQFRPLVPVTSQLPNTEEYVHSGRAMIEDVFDQGFAEFESGVVIPVIRSSNSYCAVEHVIACEGR